MNAKYNEDDWAALCATTDKLFAEFGSRRLAFAEAVRRNPGLNATPPTLQPVATPGATQGRPEDSPIVRACEALAARAAVAPGATPADPLMRAVERLGGRAAQ